MLFHSDSSGALNVGGTQIHATGVIFSNGRSYSMAMKDLQIEEELGRGNYGTVRRAIHKPTKLQMAMKVCSPCMRLSSTHVPVGNSSRTGYEQAGIYSPRA